MKMFKFMNVLALVIMFLACRVNNQVSADLSIDPSSTFVQDLANYVFAVNIYGDPDLPYFIDQNTNVTLYFPSAFNTAPLKSYDCAVLASPLTIAPITCSMLYNTMKIQGIFTSRYTIQINGFEKIQFIINAIANPSFAQTISPSIYGTLTYDTNRLLTFSPNVQQIISPGAIIAKMTISPTAAEARSTMTFIITPEHVMPSAGVLRITLDKNYTTSIYSSTLIGTSPVCIGITNNTAPNLYCALTTATNNNLLTVFNIYTNESKESYSFTIFPFLNPPTTQPIGNFVFETWSRAVNGMKIDTTSFNRITGVTPTIIQSTLLELSSYEIGSKVSANLTMTIVNAIAVTDIFYLKTPPQISVLSVVNISVSGKKANLTIINSTFLSFKNIDLFNPFSINITIDLLTLPSYAIIINSPFILYATRNSFEICYLEQAFNIELNQGVISGTLVPNSFEAGITANYTFTLTFQHTIKSTYLIEFYFSPQHFTISTLTCSSSNSINCTITSNINNLVKLSSITLVDTKSLTIILSGITNPSTVSTFTPIIINTYAFTQSNYYLLDHNSDFARFTTTARSLHINNVTITASQYVVRRVVDYTFTLNNNNNIPIGSYIQIVFPSEITFSSINCNLLCVTNVYNGSNGIQFQQIGPIGASQSVSLIVRNVINPTSTRPTSQFQVYILDSSKSRLQYLNNGPIFKATIPSVIFMSYSVVSVQNSGIGDLNLTLSVSYAIAESVSIILTVPNTVSCPLCPSQPINSSYNEIIFTNQLMVNNKYSLTLSSFKNHFSLEPIEIRGAIMSGDLLYYYGNGSFNMANTRPSQPNYSFSFTHYSLNELTNLLLNNISSATSFSHITKIILVFGSDFNLTSVDCINTGFTCSIISNQISLIINATSTTSSFTIRNIITPKIAPSTTISFTTYSSNNYIIDYGQTIKWNILCQLPCKTCSSLNSSACLSCYSDESLVQSKILYHSPNETCVSECGELFYKNYTLSTCSPCSSQCRNCYNFSSCTSCASNKYFLVSNQTCYSQCPDGYFKKTIYCVACTAIYSCHTCLDEFSCKNCFGKFLFNSICIDVCPINTTIANASTFTCDSCPINCSKCTLQSNVIKCLECSSGLFDNYQCVQTCVTFGTVPNGSVCSVCDSNCKSCSGNPSFCLSCNTNTSSSFPYLLNNRCFQICPDKYFRNNVTFTCDSCRIPCQMCLNQSTSSCINCLFPYYLSGTNCMSNCSDQFYPTASFCLPCIAPCLTCLTESLCSTCQNNSLYFPANYSCILGCPDRYTTLNNTCVSCSSQCLNCITVDFCLSCPNSSFLLNGNCLNPCIDSYYGDSLSATCLQCHFSCSTCFNTSFCLTCVQGYLIENNTCKSICLSNQVPINGICQLCNTNCLTCQNANINNCTSCFGSFKYAESINSCFSQCPSTLFYYAISNSCLRSCPDRTISQFNSTSNVSTCVSCPSYCTVCVSSLKCTTCQARSFRYGDLCYEACPTLAPFSFSFVCFTCNVIDCHECDGSNCIKCISGKLLIGNSSCISSCSTFQVYNEANRTCDTLSTGSSNSSSSSAAAISDKVALNFIPMPFLIVFSLSTIIVIILHLKNKLSAVPTLLSILGILFTLDLISIVILAFLSYFIQSELYQVCTIMLSVSLLAIFFVNMVEVIRRYKLSLCQNYVFCIFSCIHYSAITLFTANINGYNSFFIDQHKTFWSKYKFVSKLALIIYLIIIFASVLLAFVLNNPALYLFYAAIQLTILSITLVLLFLSWICLPPVPPPMASEILTMFSQKSTENLSEKNKQNDDQDQKISRKSGIKSDGQKFSEQLKNESLIIKSNYEFNDMNNVLKLNKKNIADALQKGYFRKNKDEIIKILNDEYEYSKMDEAHKLNNYLKNKEEKNDIKILNIFQNYQEEEEEEEKKIDQLGPEEQIHMVYPKKQQVQAQNLQEKKMVKSVKRQQQPQKSAQAKQSIFQSQNSGSDEMALYDEPIRPTDMNYRQNIIFQEIEEEDLTEYNSENSVQHSNIFNQDVKIDPELGLQIYTPRNASNAKARSTIPNFSNVRPSVQNNSNIKPLNSSNVKPLNSSNIKTPNSSTVKPSNTSNIKPVRVISKIQQSEVEEKYDTSLKIEDFQQDSLDDTIKVFEHSSKIKPYSSKDLKKIEPSKKPTIIHADFEEIQSVSDGGSLQFFEEPEFASRQFDSKVKNKVREIEVLQNDWLQRPSKTLQEASRHYQPISQKNKAPFYQNTTKKQTKKVTKRGK